MAAVMEDVGAIDRRDVVGFEGIYAVTKDGRVWAYPRTWKTGASLKIVRSMPGRWMKAHSTPSGYMIVKLSRGGDGGTHCLVHRLVAEAWIPNPDRLPQINHINCDKSDNRAANLEWCTASHNRRHAISMGRGLPTDNLRRAVKVNARKAHAATRKLTQDQAAKVRAAFSAGETKTAIAKRFGIERSTVWGIVNGRTYREAKP